MQIKLTIHGNQESRTGNPIPYKRTLNHSWRKDSTRYKDWQEHVRAALYDTLTRPSTRDTIRMALAIRRILYASNWKLTLPKDADVHMRILIHWANCKHGDPDNVWKGIADSIFEDDKHVNGSFEAAHAPDKKGKVEVTISIKQPPKK